jgi:hypothetical protein
VPAHTAILLPPINKISWQSAHYRRPARRISHRSKFTWRQFAGPLKRAAYGEQDVAEVSTVLRLEGRQT